MCVCTVYFNTFLDTPCDVIVLVHRYCGNEGMCGGRKVKELTPVTTPQLDAVRSFPCTGVDATCGGGSTAGPANAANICKTGVCDTASICFESTGYVFPSCVNRLFRGVNRLLGT